MSRGRPYRFGDGTGRLSFRKSLEVSLRTKCGPLRPHNPAENGSPEHKRLRDRVDGEYLSLRKIPWKQM